MHYNGITFVLCCGEVITNSKEVMNLNQSEIVQIRLTGEVVEKLEGLAWARNRSEAIRTIIESFFTVSEAERRRFLTTASEKKFGTKSE